MISYGFNFTELLKELNGKPLEEARQLVERELNLAERPVKNQRRNFDRKAYVNLVGELLFFLNSGVRPINLSPENFELFRPLCENWVNTKEMEPAVLDLFDKKQKGL